MEELELEKAKNEAIENIKNVASEAAKVAVQDAVKSIIDEKLSEVSEKMTKAVNIDDVNSLKTEVNKSIQELKAQIKVTNRSIHADASRGNSEPALKSIIAATIRKNESSLKSYRGGTIALDTKAVTIDSLGGADTTDFNNGRPQLYRNPYAPVFLRNIFPNAVATSGSVPIWKRAAVTGAAAIWQRGTGDGGVDEPKPSVSPSYVREVVTLDWIAGTTDIDREILEDVEFMASEIPYALINGPTGIFAAENKMIMDYIAANAVDFTLPSGYGDFENSLETVLAAAFGQLGDNYLAPTHILINNWDYLKYLAFNKASGSGEYDHPNLDMVVINNQLFVSNLQAVPVPDVPVDTAYVVAADHSRFLTRAGIQLRVAEEHGDNFVKNVVTYRAEERAAFYTYNANSLVKVALPTPAPAAG